MLFKHPHSAGRPGRDARSGSDIQGVLIIVMIGPPATTTWYGPFFRDARKPVIRPAGENPLTRAARLEFNQMRAVRKPAYAVCIHYFFR